MREIWGKGVELMETELLRREHVNREYMIGLKSRNLLMNFYLEAGRGDVFESDIKDIHGGWEAPTCQLRGHFLGHYLSAAALRYHETGDCELKAKADAIVDELYLCQVDNGGEWAGPIPEKYLHWIARGKQVWAPQYTLHKVFMGLIDMARYADNQKALGIAVNFSRWFDRWSEQFTREQFDDILDVETGGMLEVWAQLYELTKDEMYPRLMDRYYRGRLFDRLLTGGDPLTNMHANTTIPEVLGCARAYEVTGDEKWRRIAEAYWRCAVDERGAYVTGGQTCGEIWSPKMQLAERLGEKAQEHCTVYNMMRLAHFLFRWTGDPAYMDYYERNLVNGIMAQAHWQGKFTHGAKSDHPDHGLLTYFLPMNPGAVKGWASETGDFFCCHGSMVQANMQLGRGIFFEDGGEIYLTQYLDSKAEIALGDRTINVTQRRDALTGLLSLSSENAGRQPFSDVTNQYPHQPDRHVQRIRVDMEAPARFSLNLRMPWWLSGKPTLTLNGAPLDISFETGCFARIDREWQPGDELSLTMPMAVTAEPLPDKPDMVAFLYGPTALVGLCDGQRALHVGGARPESLLVHDNEREWSNWKSSFRTTGQTEDIRFIPFNQVGYERYSVYFPISR